MKKYLLGITAIVLAICFSAFTVPKERPSKFAAVWFDFNGTLTSQYSDATKYSLDGNNIPDCSTTVDFRCEIKADPQSGNPSLPNLSTIVETRYQAQP
jgi:hypothetical protein